jgi:hypothetical protein
VTVVFADLHCHSTASDGSLTPAQVVRRAYQAGLRALALTDHDTLAGNAEAAREAAACELAFIPGIELSCLGTHGEVHVLGYGIVVREDLENTGPFATIASLRNARDQRALAMVEKLAGHGIRLDFQAVRRSAGDAMIGRPHLARAMVEAGHVLSLQQAFDLWLAEGQPGYVAHQGLDPASAVALVKACGGVAVLAHPALYADGGHQVAQECIRAGLDGIEVWHPSANSEVVEWALALAQRHGLLCTGGSDFHAPAMPKHADLGEYGVQYAHITALRERMAARQIGRG